MTNVRYHNKRNYRTNSVSVSTADYSSATSDSYSFCSEASLGQDGDDSGSAAAAGVMFLIPLQLQASSPTLPPGLFAAIQAGVSHRLEWIQHSVSSVGIWRMQPLYGARDD